MNDSPLIEEESPHKPGALYILILAGSLLFVITYCIYVLSGPQVLPDSAFGAAGHPPALPDGVHTGTNSTP